MTSWQTPLCPFTIGFAAEKLDEIRIAVVEGFYKVPRGGVEVGGVLFGKRKAGWLLITDFRKIDTEYLSGPSFQLSSADREGLATLLAETTFDDRETEPVGLFVSHTRSRICMGDRDLELYNDFFPKAFQVALILKPENLGQVRAGYFFRQENGAVEAEASSLEFVVEPHVEPHVDQNVDQNVDPRGEAHMQPHEAAKPAEKADAAEALPVFVPKKLAPDPVKLAATPPKQTAAPASTVTIPIPEPPPPLAKPPAQERLLFQFVEQRHAWGWKSILFLLVTVAAVLSACAGYWLAVRGNQ